MIYFDNAATSFPKSKAVIDAVSDAMCRCGNPGRGAYAPSVTAAEELYSCREAIAELTGTKPEKIVLTPNTTFALNIAIKGLISKGTVITSPLEHNSVCRPLYVLAHERKVRVRTAALELHDDGATVDAVSKLCGGRTAAAVFTHASNVCGRIMPIRQISDAVHLSGGIVIIDAAQSAGHVPVTFESTGADVICLAGHKALGGPLGTGAMAISDSFDKKFGTLIEGGSGVASLLKTMPSVMPERLEAGTQNAPAFAGLAEAIKSAPRESGADVFRRICEGLKQMRGVTLYGAPENDYECYVPVLLFNIKGMQCDAVAEALSKKGICVRSGLHCAPDAHMFLGSSGGVRISVGAGNTSEEADELLRQVAALVPAR